MAARMKSKVLHREEKAFGSIDMKRVMLCGMGAGFVYALTRMMNLGMISILMVIVSFVFFLIFTGDRYGIPRYMWMFLGWQASLMVAARAKPNSFAGMVCNILSWDPSEITLNGNQLFAHSGGTVDVNLSGIEIMSSDDLDADGFEVIADDDVMVIIQ